MKKSTEGDEIFHFFRCPVRNAGPLWTIYRMHVFPSYVAYMYATWNKKSRVVEYKLNDFHFFIFYILNVCVLCIIDTYTIFDGLTHNTRGYFACCEIFFRASGGATENTSNKQNMRIRYFVHKKPSCRAVFSQPKKIPIIIPETLWFRLSRAAGLYSIWSNTAWSDILTYLSYCIYFWRNGSRLWYGRPSPPKIQGCQID